MDDIAETNSTAAIVAGGAAPSSKKPPTISTPSQEEAEKHGFNVFSHLLDVRVLRALASLGFGTPTLVQQKAIPLALAGKDILARARTGSGKTLAYGLPLVQKILDAKKSVSPSDQRYQQTRAMILVPTRELSEQVTGQIGAILEYCHDTVSIANIARDASTAVQKLLLSEKPDIVVATPSRALHYLQTKSLIVSDSLESLAIDEADLILSYGHDHDVRALLSGGFLPKVFQSFLMSATMTSDVQKLKGLVMRNPAILKLEDDASSAANLSQYYAHVSEEDKFLLTYVLLKLKLIRGKCIIFVNEVDRCYRLKLFLEQFGLKSCVLNAELPINSRYHIVQEFNKGVYDYIIATDESSSNSAERDEDEVEEGENEATASDKKRKRNNSDKKKNKDKNSITSASTEYGVSRGIDFIAVACVLNFDLPTSYRSYIHRIGRTARAGASGTSLSFIVPTLEHGKSKYLGCLTTVSDSKIFNKIVSSQPPTTTSSPLTEWKFESTQINPFRYRVQDVLRSITKSKIKESRIHELKQEIFNSQKLESYFQENPTDLIYLKHDRPIINSRSSHLKHVPNYLLPTILSTSSTSTKSLGYIFKNKPHPTSSSHFKKSSSSFKNKFKLGKKKIDPLKKFSSK